MLCGSPCKSQDYQRWQGCSYHLIHTSAGKSWGPSKVLIQQGQEDQRGVVIFPRPNSKLMAELQLEEGFPPTPTLHPYQYTNYLVPPSFSRAFLEVSKGVESWSWLPHSGDTWLLQAKSHQLANLAKEPSLLLPQESKGLFGSKSQLWLPWEVNLAWASESLFSNRSFITPMEAKDPWSRKNAPKCTKLGGL